MTSPKIPVPPNIAHAFKGRFGSRGKSGGVISAFIPAVLMTREVVVLAGPGVKREGVKVQVVNEGRSEQEKSIGFANPPEAVTVKRMVAACPARKVAEPGWIESAKSGSAATSCCSVCELPAMKLLSPL